MNQTAAIRTSDICHRLKNTSVAKYEVITLTLDTAQLELILEALSNRAAVMSEAGLFTKSAEATRLRETIKDAQRLEAGRK